jgi:succinylarginine dihydrolase
MTQITEVNFDGLVGPTHNYAGLSYGNIASETNRAAMSKPRAAVLQGIAKMRRLAALGLPQAVLPPHERPHIPFLRSLGFAGADRAVWEAAFKAEPVIARQAASASAMWAANAATVSPSPDCADGKLHLSVANLSANLHRRLEAEETFAALEKIFPGSAHFAIHPALPGAAALGDEGAANHMRLSPAGMVGAGIEVFVYGGAGGDATRTSFPARQTLEASRAIARRHGLDPARTLFVRQSANAIDGGAFHNDVVAVAHEDVLFAHEAAFADPAGLARDLAAAADGYAPQLVTVPSARVPLADAVKSYLFNAQLVREPGANQLTLVVPQEAQETASSWAYLGDLIADPASPIGRLEVLDVRESMRNGGGPACLRLRVQMSAAERAAAAQGFFLTDALGDQLEAWAHKHYRDRLGPDDLADPNLLDESRAALDALSQILPLGSRHYRFQRAGA